MTALLVEEVVGTCEMLPSESMIRCCEPAEGETTDDDKKTSNGERVARVRMANAP